MQRCGRLGRCSYAAAGARQPQEPLFVAALAAEAGSLGWQKVSGSYLRAFELGKQQGSDYYTCSGACLALKAAAAHPEEVGHTAFAAALAAFEQAAEPALRRCKRLLPEAWVQRLKELVGHSNALVPGAHSQVQLLQQRASEAAGASDAAGASRALQSSVAAQAAAFEAQREASGGRCFPHAIDCDGCGERAVGLRRCSRCKQAQYCR